MWPGQGRILPWLCGAHICTAAGRRCKERQKIQDTALLSHALQSLFARHPRCVKAQSRLPCMRLPKPQTHNAEPCPAEIAHCRTCPFVAPGSNCDADLAFLDATKHGAEAKVVFCAQTWQSKTRHHQLKTYQAGRRISIWRRCNLETETGVACHLETVYKGLASFQIFAIIVVNYVIGVFRGRVCI